MLKIDYDKLDKAPVNEKDVISEFEWLFDDFECLNGPDRFVLGFIDKHPTILQWQFDQSYITVSPIGQACYPNSYFKVLREHIDSMNHDAFEYGNGIVANIIRGERDQNHIIQFYHYDMEDNAGAIELWADKT